MNELYLKIPKQRRNVAYWCLLAGRTGLLVGRKYFFLLNSRQNCKMHSKDSRHTVQKKGTTPSSGWVGKGGSCIIFYLPRT